MHLIDITCCGCVSLMKSRETEETDNKNVRGKS